MAKVDVNSDTWEAIQAFVAAKRKDAVEMLIAGKDSDKQRGVIHVLDELIDMQKTEDKPIQVDDYN